MHIPHHAVAVGALVCGLSVLSAAQAQLGGRFEELVCNGSVSYGQSKFSDRITLKVSSRDVEVNGRAGDLSTFEGVHRYKICSESQNALEFEYTTTDKCGTDSTRAGRLDKVLGDLRLSRSDRGQPFVGDYKCKPLQRVLK